MNGNGNDFNPIRFSIWLMINSLMINTIRPLFPEVSLVSKGCFFLIEKFMISLFLISEEFECWPNSFEFDRKNQQCNQFVRLLSWRWWLLLSWNNSDTKLNEKIRDQSVLWSRQLRLLKDIYGRVRRSFHYNWMIDSEFFHSHLHYSVFSRAIIIFHLFGMKIE